jgi:hypothetical protein
MILTDPNIFLLNGELDIVSLVSKVNDELLNFWHRSLVQWAFADRGSIVRCIERSFWYRRNKKV